MDQGQRPWSRRGTNAAGPWLALAGSQIRDGGRASARDAAESRRAVACCALMAAAKPCGARSFRAAAVASRLAASCSGAPSLLRGLGIRLRRLRVGLSGVGLRLLRISLVGFVLGLAVLRLGLAAAAGAFHVASRVRRTIEMSTRSTHCRWRFAARRRGPPRSGRRLPPSRCTQRAQSSA